MAIEYVVLGFRRTLANCLVPQEYAIAFGKVASNPKYGMQVNAQTARRYYNASAGKSISEMLVEIAQTYGSNVSPQRLAAACDEFDQLVIGKPFEVVDGVENTLKRFGKMGIGVVISSNMPQAPLRSVVKELGLKKYIDMHLGANRTIMKGPVHVKQFAIRYGIRMKDFCRTAAFAGSNPSDMYAAMQCRDELGLEGWPLAIGVSTRGTISNAMLEQAGANYRAPDIARLPDLIEKINAGDMESCTEEAELPATG